MTNHFITHTLIKDNQIFWSVNQQRPKTILFFLLIFLSLDKIHVELFQLAEFDF